MNARAAEKRQLLFVSKQIQQQFGFLFTINNKSILGYVATTITATWPSAGVAVSSESRMLDERLDQLLFSSSNK